jgi:hypothetical protein
MKAFNALANGGVMGAMVTRLGTAKNDSFRNWSSVTSTTYNYKLKKTGADLPSPGSHMQLGWRSYIILDCLSIMNSAEAIRLP